VKIKYRYTYRLTRLRDSAFYTGSRSAATCPPEEDFGTHYFTSGVLEKEFRANPEQFTWKIHSEDYADDVSMKEDEQRLIRESWDEPGRMNRSAWPVVFEIDEEWLEKNRLKAKDPVWSNSHNRRDTNGMPLRGVYREEFRYSPSGRCYRRKKLWCAQIDINGKKRKSRHFTARAAEDQYILWKRQYHLETQTPEIWYEQYAACQASGYWDGVPTSTNISTPTLATLFD